MLAADFRTVHLRAASSNVTCSTHDCILVVQGLACTTEPCLATNQINIEHAAQSVCYGASFELCLHDAVLLPGMAWHIALNNAKALMKVHRNSVYPRQSCLSCNLPKTIDPIHHSGVIPNTIIQGQGHTNKVAPTHGTKGTNLYNVYDASTKVM